MPYPAGYRIGWRSLRRVAPNLTPDQARELARVLGVAMRAHGITTRKRAAAFVAQIAHESGGFRWREELASGAAYEGRRDLGNVHAGDGRRFKGRGYLQITGRANYAAVSKALGVDFVKHPERLKWPTYAARSAAWWWTAHGCNVYADRGDFVGLTRRINGGTNGLADRIRYWKRARLVARWLTPRR